MSTQEYSAGPFMQSEDAYTRLTDEQVRETEAYTLGVQTVLWGLQWVKAGAGLRHWAAPLPGGEERLPIDPMPHGYNFFGHARELLTHELRILETPNTETLYSIAVVDLKDGPVVIEHPDHGDRYFRTSIWEIHGDTHTISQKQDGPHPPPYALVQLDWKGTLAEGLKVIRVPSRLVVCGAHIAVYGQDDLINVHALHQGYKLTALGDWGHSNNPLKPLEQRDVIHPLVRPNTKTPPELVFFEMLGETLKDITLREDEVAFARQTERIGLTLKDGFRCESLDVPTAAGLKRAVLDGQAILEHRARNLAPLQPGGAWIVGQDLTNLDDWLLRGAVGWKFVWGDLSTEVLYPMARNDRQGQPLVGEHDYLLQFPEGELPAARYWRISMYDLDGFFVGNPIKRYGIGNMAENLELNPDGSLTLYIQHESPGKDKEVNWLPTPKDGFFLIMRMYQPEERMYHGEYIIPAVTRQD